MVVYLHIQIIVILQMNYFLNISSCYIWKPYFLEKNKNIICSKHTQFTSLSLTTKI